MGLIYKIINKINNKVYIGQTIDIKFNKRYNNHISKLKNNKHPNFYLQNAFNKYGEENFEFIIIEDNISDMDTLNLREKYWGDYYNALDRECGYNLLGFGNNRFQLEETKIKISKTKLGVSVFSPKQRRQMSVDRSGKNHWCYGTIRPQSTREKLRKANIGKKQSKRTIRKRIGKMEGNFFGFRGVTINKHSKKIIKKNPFKLGIGYNGHRKHISTFPDPVSCQIIYDIYQEEIWGD